MKKIILFCCFLFLFSFTWSHAQENEVRNYRVFYEVTNLQGEIVRSSTIIITITGFPNYNKIIEETAKILGFKKEQRGIEYYQDVGPPNRLLFLLIKNYEPL